MPFPLQALRHDLRHHAPHTYSGTQFAAVAAIFREGRNGLELLIIERAQHERDPWSGHLAFPGGRASASDASLLQTAIRETREELGFDLQACAALLGALDQLPARRSPTPGLIIAPYAFELQREVDLRPDPREVSRAFWVELRPLVAGERNTTVQFQHGRQRIRFPGYRIGERVLWGLTYQMLESILERVRRHAPSHAGGLDSSLEFSR